MVPYADVVELSGAVKKARSTDMMIGRLLSSGSLEHVFEESPWCVLTGDASSFGTTPNGYIIAKKHFYT